MSGRVLVLQHQHGEGPGEFGRLLGEAGVGVDVVNVAEAGVPDGAGYDALLILGGDMQVWEEDLHPWLVAEKQLIREWVGTRRRPAVGICLGHQLLGDALGGEVRLRAVGEAGIHDAHPGPALSGTDPLLGRLPRPWPSLQWHHAEVVTPPPGAAVLAATEACAVQAMRIDGRAWGLQFHPEVDRATAESWGTQEPFRELLAATGGPDAPAAFPAVLAAAADAMAGVTRSIVSGLLEVIG